MHRLLRICLFIFLSPSLALAQQQKVHRKIDAVLKAMQAYQREGRKSDSAAGVPLGRHTEESYKEDNAFYVAQYARLEKIKPASLDFDNQVNLELLRHDLLDNLAEYRFRSYLNPILADEGFHTSLARRGTQTIRTAKDAEQYLAALNDMPRYADEYLQLMRTGISVGISQPAVILTGYEATYKQHIVTNPEQSVFWQPFTRKSASISEADWQSLRERGRRVILTGPVLAYQKINDFFEREYLPNTRKTLGAAHFPDGKAYYEDRVRHYTTTGMSSEEVYQVGLKEVTRIRSEMDSVMRIVGFKGTFKEFITFLRTDARFYPKTGEDLLKEASFIAKKIDGKLSSIFGKLPRQPYSVAPVPAYLAPTYTTGRYSGGTNEYWVNTYNLPSRTLYTLEALTLHEAVPGHHLQGALARELTNLPAFRRGIYINAFGEGWGLYSEYLGHELGFYKDPYSLFGRLTYDMWRACRLVIDVGIHTKDWTRDQAVAYLADNTALSLHEVNTEVNRYISWPGQALAYKIGELKIREMRKRSEDALKENFDVRRFHDMVLSNGSVTLSVLEKMTDRFIAQEQKRISDRKRG